MNTVSETLRLINFEPQPYCAQCINAGISDFCKQCDNGSAFKMKNDTVTISKSDLRSLIWSSARDEALWNAGVGYEEITRPDINNDYNEMVHTRLKYFGLEK